MTSLRLVSGEVGLERKQSGSRLSFSDPSGTEASLRFASAIMEFKTAAFVGKRVMFQRELAINIADWLPDKDGMGFGEFHTLMK